jgi:hypothetical protein
VSLGAEDWTSGETVWLLDVVAADRRQATSVLANFRQLAGARAVKIAPLVARLIEPEAAAKLRGAAAGAGEETKQGPTANATDNSKISGRTRNQVLRHAWRRGNRWVP